MRNLTSLLLAFICILVLTGCGNQLDNVKEAVSGINTAAHKAANATSLDVHKIRAIEIEYENEKFTINDLFKTILRDIQWDYENLDTIQKLTIKGTWKNGLFDQYQFSEDVKEQLLKDGKVVVELEIIDQHISPDSTKVRMTLNNELLVEDSGKEALESLYNYYISL